MKAKCFECAYCDRLPGNAHIKCKFAWSRSEHKAPRGDAHGIANGWYLFPLNFDPVWMREECKAFSTEIDDNEMIAKHDALGEMLAILLGV